MRISLLALSFLLGAGLAGCGGSGNSMLPSSGVSASNVGPQSNAVQQSDISPQSNAGPQSTFAATSGVAATAGESQSVALSGQQQLLTGPDAAGAAGTYNSLVMGSAPIAYYQLGDSSSTMTDSSTNRINGSYGQYVKHNAGVLTSAGNQSAMFPGSPKGSSTPANTGSVVANAAFLRASNAVSIEAWFRLNDWNRTGTFMPLVSYGRDAQGEPWIIELTPESSLQLFIKTNGGAGKYLLKPNTARVTPSQVYQVVATYDGSNARIYLNGTLVGSMPATGTLNYTGVHPEYGLGIGGALGGTLPTFNGKIGNVSIYSKALSAADVENHFINGEPAIVVNEKPSSSDAFVDSIGVNTHIVGSGTPYNNPWSTFVSLVESAGIRHIRDSLASTPTWYPTELKQLATAGIRASLVGNYTQTAQQIKSILPYFGNAVEAVEGLNEPDLLKPNGAAWPTTTQNFQKTLWSAVKGNSATANIHVLGPVVTWESSASTVGSLSGYMDRGNIHDYFSAYNPGTTGWGPLDANGIYGSIIFDMNFGRIMSGSNAQWVTETGYRDAGPYSVDDRIQARYVPRIFLENFLHGIAHSAIYQFYDDAENNTSSHYGLVSVSHVPKPQYYAIKTLTHALADPGAGFTPRTLSYVLGGNTSNVQHLLLQKRDGTYELIIWVETESYNPLTLTDLTIPAQTVTLKLSTSPSSAHIETIGDSGNPSTGGLSFQSGATSFRVDDHVTIVSFK